MSDAVQLTAELKARAAQLGFTLAGACPAVTPTGLARFHDWLSAGYAGEMRYLVDRAAAYSHPNHVLDGVRSLLMLGWNYRTQEPTPGGAGTGRIARYAWGAVDYHDLLHSRLHELADFHRSLRPGSKVRGVVDSAPLLEREFAHLAGLGWIGKNTLLLNRRAGSWFFLAALLTDAELTYDAPLGTDHCGSCRACLDACPTQAFPQPYVLDATRCLSYLTIEARSLPVPPLRDGDATNDWVFGCDICQEVCPWNRKAPTTDEPGLAPLVDSNPLALAPLFQLTDDDFRQRFRRTPLWRPKRRGLLRNAALVLGRQADPNTIPALTRGLNDDEPLIRSAAAWALGQFANARLENAGVSAGHRNAARPTSATLPPEPLPKPAPEQHKRLGNSQRINWPYGFSGPEITSDQLSNSAATNAAIQSAQIAVAAATAMRALQARFALEESPEVISELQASLSRLDETRSRERRDDA